MKVNGAVIAQMAEDFATYQKHPDLGFACCSAHAVADHVPALLAELAAVRAERDQARAELAKYVGKEPTVVEEMAYLNRCLNAVYDLCDEAKRSNSLGITIEAVEQAADGQRADAPADNRRRLYVDGKGNGWIDAGVDSGGLRWIASIDDRVMEATRESVTAETGSLREIGRCW
ncbi:MAG TPA: hypothetical protein VK028_02425 [Micromonosporaceae bacterium]|nr:hypothetical protein [Micromonosporaceae bacterium]